MEKLFLIMGLEWRWKKIKDQQEERNEQLVNRKSKCHLKNLYPENTTSANLRT